MSQTRFIWIGAAALAGVLAGAAHRPVRAQGVTTQPERKLVGLSLGRPFLDVIRRFGKPSEIQTVSLSNSQEQLPGLGGGSAMGGSAMGGEPAMGGMGMMMGAGGGNGPGGGGMPFGGGSPFGGMPMMGGGGGNGPGGGRMAIAGMPGGIPALPPAGMGMMAGGGNGPGGGMMGMAGAPGAGAGMMGGFGAAGAGPNLPEYSTAILWIYKLGKEKDTRLEFLINEDGRLAQISLAAPADKAKGVAKTIPLSRTAKGVTLGTNLTRVMDAYGYPERHRLLPGLRFYEVYYSKAYHAAFTFDTQKNMNCVRITIALAD